MQSLNSSNLQPGLTHAVPSELLRATATRAIERPYSQLMPRLRIRANKSGSYSRTVPSCLFVSLVPVAFRNPIALAWSCAFRASNKKLACWRPGLLLRSCLVLQVAFVGAVGCYRVRAGGLRVAVLAVSRNETLAHLVVSAYLA